MLASNFKTAAELDLTNAQWSALIKVLGMLERGELREVKVLDDDLEKDPAVFSMQRWTCCIHGHANRISHGVFDYDKFIRPIKLDNLFSKATHNMKEATEALRDYLTGAES